MIAALGRVRAVSRLDDGARIEISSPLARELVEGASVAVNGVCLSVTRLDGDAFAADVMRETLARSALGLLEPGSRVNLEPALRAGERLGGHIVQGHVDGIGRVLAASGEGFARRLEIEPPGDLMRYVVAKGSIAVDGVSLTVAACGERSFTVSLIPETLERTNLDVVQPGQEVNLEVDVLAKYVEKAVRSR